MKKRGKSKSTMSIHWKLLISFFCVTMIPLMTVAVFLFMKSSTIIYENASQYTTQLLQQTNREIQLRLSQIAKDSVNIITSPGVQSLQSLSEANYTEKRDMRAQLYQLINTNGVVERAVIFDREGNKIVETGSPQTESLLPEEQTFIAQLGGKVSWHYTPKVSEFSIEPLLKAERAIKNLQGNDPAIKGYLLFEIPESIVFESIRQLELGETGIAFIIDDANHIVTSQNRKMIGQTVHPAIEGKLTGGKGTFVEKINGEMYFISYHASPEIGWKTIGMVPTEEMTPGLLEVQKTNMYVIVFWVFVAIIISLLLTKSVTGPIKRLIEKMRQVETGDFSGEIRLQGSKEVTDLSLSFNRMTRRLNRMIQKVYQKEISEKQAQLKALQAQIHPHFLYNTLDSIYWSLYIKGEESIGNVVVSLSNMLRYSISEELKDVSLEKEIENCKHYFEIQKLKYGEKVRFTVHVPKVVLQCQVPKMILQPLIENAIMHGMETTQQEVHIQVLSQESDNVLYLSVIDNGSGFPYDVKEFPLNPARLPENSIGLMNVNERLRLRYGKNYGVSIESKKGEGTAVTLRLPSLEENE
ncbi:cache domain-containing sensor histidine kinase [Aureibacillus halotolerans]|uniref:Histidine kinase/DNA gyrase B/HSP90-like ATPase n=1 Tax=Aureibacillus halotolerans TaxID=1508390 RepID=A0A4R6U009_9BACI|nr:sensor histidine kinase [Aureibacillus halotolerans]TDQ37659.1 histidine kinase/DNA gyrase B/HSP90-like ATPase [Aureibacillus halotolerans]